VPWLMHSTLLWPLSLLDTKLREQEKAQRMI
jgi:hypothetical protein